MLSTETLGLNNRNYCARTKVGKGNIEVGREGSDDYSYRRKRNVSECMDREKGEEDRNMMGGVFGNV